MGIEFPCIDEETLAVVQAKIDSLMPVLKSARVRKLWETDSSEKTTAAVKKKMES